MATRKSSTLVAGARQQKVIIEFTDPGWMVLHHDGTIEEWDTASYAMKSVRRAATRRNTTITITAIEWRNVPTTFDPPKA